MKKSLSLILAAILILALASCAPAAQSDVVPREGFYLTGNKDTDHYLGTYLSLSVGTHSWQSSPGLVMSIAVGGDWELQGDRLIAREGYGGDATVEFRIISETELELTSIDAGDDENFIAYWLHEGDVYHFVALPSADGVSDDTEMSELFNSVDTADDAMAKAMMGDAVSFFGMKLYNGRDLWDSFVDSVDSGEPARILCATYYTLDPERVSKELYEQEKDDYPVLFYSLVEYDGDGFTVTVRESDREQPERVESYKCLNHYTGEAPPSASFRTYDYYVLTDDPDVTWDEIEWGMLSSQSGDWIRHCTVYQDTFD